MKAVLAAFNQEKALVGAFSVITNLRMDLLEALVSTHQLVVVGHEALEVDKAADGGRQVGQLVPAEIGGIYYSHF